MAEDFRSAIMALGVDLIDTATPPEGDVSTGAPLRPADAGATEAWRQQALQLMREADNRLRAGDFAGFGAAWDRLRTLLEQRPQGAAPR
jgi:hypothetical protein